MAKINKIKKNGTTIYPLTIPQAVIDPTTGESVAKTLADGKFLSSLEQTTTSTADGGTNIITATLKDGTTRTFQVKNGNQGNSGYTGAAGELEVVNNLTAGGATSALSAEMGKTLNEELSQKSEVVNLLGTANGISGMVDVSEYEAYDRIISATDAWAASTVPDCYSRLIPVRPGKYTITASATTQSIIGFLSAIPVSGQTVSYGTVNGVAETSRISIAANTSQEFTILDSDTSIYLCVRDDVSAVLKPTIMYTANVELYVPLRTEVDQKVSVVDKRLSTAILGINGIVNILNYSEQTVGVMISPVNGGERSGSTYEDYTASGFIPVTEEAVYVFNGWGKLYGAWYDSMRVYISGIQYDSSLPDDSTYTAPDDAAYLRVSTQSTYYPSASIKENRADTSLNGDISVSVGQVSGLSSRIKDELSVIVPNVDGYIDLGNLSDTVDGKYVNPRTGDYGGNVSFTATDYISTTPGTEYKLYGFKQTYGAWYDSEEHFLSGIISEVSTPDGYGIIAPDNAAFFRISTETTYFAEAVILTGELELSERVSVSASQIRGLGTAVKYNTITVKPSGGGDYTTLSAAFDSITDSSYSNRYIVEFYGDGTEYNTLVDKPYVSGQIGLRVPNFTKLLGVGGPEKCILGRRLSSADQYDSVINLYASSELEGFTIIGVNTRYAIHDDYYRSDEIDLNNYERRVSNCIIVAGDTYYHRIYGAGFRSGCKWIFEDCVFKSLDGSSNGSFSCHNNTGFSNPATIKMVNCRFDSSHSTYGNVIFGSLNTNANNIVNRIDLYGCRLSALRLYEESVQTYGSGILFKVSGFANSLKTGDPQIVISHTDGVDYSDRIDLI